MFIALGCIPCVNGCALTAILFMQHSKQSVNKFKVYKWIKIISHHHRFFRHYFNSKHGITCTNKDAYKGVVKTLRILIQFLLLIICGSIWANPPACVALLLTIVTPTPVSTHILCHKTSLVESSSVETRSCDVALQHAVIDVPVRPALVDIGISLRRYIW